MLEGIRSDIAKLIAAYEAQKQFAAELSARVGALELQNLEYRKHIAELEREIDNRKLADAFKGGAADSQESKERIAKLIKEIDRCIALMEK
ncbi:MAG: hypothetical protein HUJ94_09020 [Bacteroidales bacterium]|nr:hypothetical protein [Bacteroidales bacterium]